MKGKKVEQYYDKLKKKKLDELEAKKLKKPSDWKYIGYEAIPEIADYPKTKPRSATFVIALEWSWSPAHSRQDYYYISTNKSRTHWFFWYSYIDDNDWSYPWIHNIVAIGPKKGVDKYEAAKKLLEIFWRGERDEFDSPDDGFGYTSFGIFSDEEVDPIAKRVLID